jgi:thiamine transport system substrate-binding protein
VVGKRPVNLIQVMLANGVLVRFLLLALLWASVAQADCDLSIYTYDSIVARGGLGPEIFPDFEKRSGCKIKTLASGDGVQALGRMELDAKRGKLAGQILLGIDQSLWSRSKSYQEAVSLPALGGVGQEALDNGFVPYDYGVLALIGNDLKDPPHSLNDLLDSKWKKKFILEDPRMSTPGLELVLFTAAVLGEKLRIVFEKRSAPRLELYNEPGLSRRKRRTSIQGHSF